MAETTMSVKGQIVIPSKVRERLKLKPGQRFDVDVMSDGSVLVIPIPVDVISAMKLPDGERLEKALSEERGREQKRDRLLVKELQKC
jgi:AbrB family looped-hinge helix DNA binding protein